MTVALDLAIMASINSGFDMASKKRIHQMTIAQWEAAFPDDDACKAYLTRHRWPLGVRCARCGMDGCYDLSKSRPFHWQCHKCAPQGYRFSVLAGTIFENTNLPLRMWFRIIHMMLTSKKGVSALQVHRTLGTGSYKTAWYACHRIRGGLANKDFNKLMGIVEADETLVGGKNSRSTRPLTTLAANTLSARSTPIPLRVSGR